MEGFLGAQAQRHGGAAALSSRPAQPSGSAGVGPPVGREFRLDTAGVTVRAERADRNVVRHDLSVVAVEANAFAAQKKSLHARERDTEAHRQRGQELVERIRAVPPERLIYLDESGVTTSMTRLYARSRDGARIHEASPGGHWKILTILGALSTRGMIATMTIEEPTDGDIFLAYLDHVLCRRLRLGDVVVMDNLSAHKCEGVRARIEAAGAELLYLPPTRPIRTPSKKPGPNSKHCFARPKPAPAKHWIRPSPRRSHNSLPTTLKPGSELASALYSNCENAF